MQPTQVARPFHREGWVDGVRLVSRQGLDHTRRFQKLASAIAALPVAEIVIDGGVAIFAEHLVSRFEWLRRRPAGGAATLPVDVLYLDGRDLRSLALRERRQALEKACKART